MDHQRDGGDVMPDTGWHLDKRVPVSIILVLLTQGVAGLWIIAEMRKDIDVLKVQILETRERERYRDVQFSETVQQLRGDILEVSRKLDRLIEKRQ